VETTDDFHFSLKVIPTATSSRSTNNNAKESQQGFPPLLDVLNFLAGTAKTLSAVKKVSHTSSPFPLPRTFRSTNTNTDTDTEDALCMDTEANMVSAQLTNFNYLYNCLTKRSTDDEIGFAVTVRHTGLVIILLFSFQVIGL